MTIDRILVAVSFSERSIDAVRRAAAISAERHASLTLLHVVEPAKRLSVRRHPAQQALVQARVADARKELALLAGQIAARERVPVNVRVEVGDKVGAIADACDDADVLFIGGTSPGSLAATFHMTTVERLVRRCRIPILVVKQGNAGRCGHALVPVDGTSDSVVALREAARLCPDAKLTVFHAMDSRRMESMRIIGTPLSIVRKRHAHRVIRKTDLLKSVATRAQLATKAISYRLAYGEVWSAVLSIQRELNAQVVALVSRRGTSLSDFLLGSSVRRLLKSLNCDVLVVPGESRSSPTSPART